MKIENYEVFSTLKSIDIKIIFAVASTNADNNSKTFPEQYTLILKKAAFNPLRPNSDLSQTSYYNNKGLSVSEVMRIENMITQVQCY